MSLVEFAKQNESHRLEEVKPIHIGATLKNNDAFIEYFQEHRPIIEEFAKEFIEDSWSNLLWYTGEYLPQQNLRITGADGREINIPRQLSPFVINMLAHLTDKRTADLSVYKPNHEVDPEDESEKDRMAGRAIDVTLQHLKRVNAMERHFDKVEKWTMVFGAMYSYIYFDEMKGDRKKPGSEEREGEVVCKPLDPWHVLPWPARHYEHLKCMTIVEEICHVEEARKKYKMKSLETTNETSLFTFSSPYVEELRAEEVVIYNTIYPPDEFLPNGAFIRHTATQVIGKINTTKYPWGHEDFPVEQYTDNDVPGRFWPKSFYARVKPLQHTTNVMNAQIKRYIGAVAHPKWSVVRGSVNLKSLGNAATVMQHRPGQPPVLHQVKSIGGDIFNYLSSIEQKMNLLSFSHQISLGELPPNTRSGIMISRLQEIEQKGQGPQIDKRNAYMARVLLKMAAVAHENYPKQSPKRLERVYGKQLVDEVLKLGDQKISAQHRITIQNPSGFSAQLSGRLEEIGFINEHIDPSLLTRQQKLDIIGGGLRDKQYDAVTAALRSSEKENEEMSEGIVSASPIEEEDHITHWQTHYLFMNSTAYKKFAPELQANFRAHLGAHEELMEGVLKKDPMYGERVTQLDGYPRIYVPEPPPPPQPSLEETKLQQEFQLAQAEIELRAKELEANAREAEAKLGIDTQELQHKAKELQLEAMVAQETADLKRLEITLKDRESDKKLVLEAQKLEQASNGNGSNGSSSEPKKVTSSKKTIVVKKKSDGSMVGEVTEGQ